MATKSTLPDPHSTDTQAQARRRRALTRIDGQPATRWEDWAPASHPSVLPEPPHPGPAPACFRPPGVFAPTEDLLAHRDEMARLAPMGEFYARALDAVENALAWRARCPEHARYWEEDSGFSVVVEGVDGRLVRCQWVPGNEIDHARVAAQDLADRCGRAATIYRDGLELEAIGAHEGAT